jgi:hypothetical protein
MPWAVRNCLVLGSFMPLGSQAWMELPASYSDRALSNGGTWYNLHLAGSYRSVLLPAMQAGGTGELAVAERGRSQAWAWIKHNVARLPQLFLQRIWSEVRRPGLSRAVPLILVLLGLVVIRDQPVAQVLIGILSMNFVSIGLTWSVGGRFLVPVLPVVCLAAGLEFWAVLTILARIGVRGSPRGEAA